MNVELIYDASVKDEVEIRHFEDYASSLGVDVRDAFNIVSLLVAQRYSGGIVSYEDADVAMNAIWSLMSKYIVENNQNIVEPTFSIYCAFDQGEYVHEDGLDPVEAYTNPSIEQILRNA